MNIVEFLQSNSIALIAVFTPIILGLVQVIKQFVDSSRWAPVFSIIIGILLGIFFSGLTLAYGILLGVISGLSASGFYSGTKRLAE